MKYIKLFESLENLKVGDYVIIDPEPFSSSDLKEQLMNNVGKVIEISIGIEFPIKVDFDKCLINVDYNEIIYWSDDKDELEARIAAKKFNL